MANYNCKCGMEHMKDELDKFVTVATLLIIPNNLCQAIKKMFKTNQESADLLSVNIKDLETNEPSDILEQNSAIQEKNIPVRFGYMMAKMVKSDLFKNISNLNDTHKILCQVELPNQRYDTIDIGTTSNGKYEQSDTYLSKCSMRELNEETGIILKSEHYCPFFQKATRLLYKAQDLPLYYISGKAFCYIILL